jgi:O-methyltransferase
VVHPALPLFRVAQAMSAPWARKLPLRVWPAWLGALHGVKVPRGVVRNPVKSPAGTSNINILLRLLEQTEHLGGDVAECGVFRGATLLAMGLHLHQGGIDKTLLGFDSFQGFDESVAIDVALGGRNDPDKRVGGFSATSYKDVARNVSRFHLEKTVTLVKGFFATTLPQYAQHRFCFVHLDCDIYQSYRDTLTFFYPRMTSGGIILLDEYNDPPWPGCNRAVDEFLSTKPETLVEIEQDNYQKWYLRKT